jgi:hypothetical protein
VRLLSIKQLPTRQIRPGPPSGTGNPKQKGLDNKSINAQNITRNPFTEEKVPNATVSEKNYLLIYCLLDATLAT